MLYRSVDPLAIGILPGIMGHTVSDVTAIKVVLIRGTGVLNPSIGMNDQLAYILALLAGKGLGQAANLTCRAQILAAMTSHDLTGIQIDHKADVVPAAAAPHIRDVGLPHLVWTGNSHTFNSVSADADASHGKRAWRCFEPKPTFKQHLLGPVATARHSLEGGIVNVATSHLAMILANLAGQLYRVEQISLSFTQASNALMGTLPGNVLYPPDQLHLSGDG